MVIVYFGIWIFSNGLGFLCSLCFLLFFHFLDPKGDLILNLLFSIFDRLNLILFCLIISLALTNIFFLWFSIRSFILFYVRGLTIIILFRFFFCINFYLSDFAATFLLMLGHVPFRYVLLFAILADKWSNSSMLS